METKREAAQTPCSCGFRVTFIGISHYISAIFWNYSHFGLQVLIWFHFGLTFFLFQLDVKFLVRYKEPKRHFRVLCQFNSASWMETRLVSFMSVGAVRQTSRTGTEVFGLAHAGELWIFNILPHETESRRCKICLCVSEKLRVWGWLRRQQNKDGQ